MTERRFDWEEAKARFEAGETLAALARAYSVSPAAIRWAVNPQAAAEKKVYARSWQRRNYRRVAYDACPICSGAKTKKSELCLDCRKEFRLVSDIKDLDGPRPGELDYFTDTGRYGLLAVSGYSAGRWIGWATTFSIVDLDCATEVRKVRRYGMSAVKASHKQLVKDVQKMNRTAKRVAA